MALLRWIHLRKLVPIEDLIAGAASAPRGSHGGSAGAAARAPRQRRARQRRQPCRDRVAAPVGTRPPLRQRRPRDASAAGAAPRPQRGCRVAGGRRPPLAAAPTASSAPCDAGNFKDALLAEIRKSKVGVLQHGRRAGAEDRGRRRSRHVHVLAGAARAERHVRAEPRVARSRSRSRWPDARSRSSSRAGRRAAAARRRPSAGDRRRTRIGRQESALREQALADAGVQAMLEVFPAEIRDVEEM